MLFLQCGIDFESDKNLQIFEMTFLKVFYNKNKLLATLVGALRVYPL